MPFLSLSVSQSDGIGYISCTVDMAQIKRQRAGAPSDKQATALA